MNLTKVLPDSLYVCKPSDNKATDQYNNDPVGKKCFLFIYLPSCRNLKFAIGLPADDSSI